MAIVLEVLAESLQITALIFILMVLVEFLAIRFEPKIKSMITRHPKNQYALSSALGAIPGCTGGFAAVSLYQHGIIGFGALSACMVATLGDETFFMLALLPPAQSIGIIGLCFVLAIISGFMSDFVFRKLAMQRSEKCCIPIHKDKETSIRHFFKEHAIGHIAEKHIPKIFAWIFITLLALTYLMQSVDIETILPQNAIYVLILAALIGILPISGPHMVFVALFSQGLVPLSVLVTSSIVQDGHAMLPLLSFSMKDATRVKAFNLLFGLAIGLILLAAGL